MMPKKKFYSFCRYNETDNDGNKVLTLGYLPREGYVVPNDFGLDLAVYRDKKGVGVLPNLWYVIDCYCGLSVGSGCTKKEAIANSFDRLSKVDMELYRKKQIAVIDEHGEPPGHRIFYL